MGSKRYQEALERIPQDTRRFAKTSVEVIDQIHSELKRKGWKQNDLAKALGKQESEVSKWLTPGHNFTLKSLAKIEAALEVSILKTSTAWKAANYAATHPRMSANEAYRRVRASADTPSPGEGAIITFTIPLVHKAYLKPVFDVSLLDKNRSRKPGTSHKTGNYITFEQNKMQHSGG
ncbi:hypothetical protein LEM8419_00754 [Neolewinella maritima]|uniref:HTH cro/C1-type domain-containing protein n=1 Tax=Neolewinella maritima TaxID=1383882 RepID=A0ABN8EZS5_9BACT|nr:helix-turn-helix transcriptional regulator [Neolewinella maritima]CAH0999454.1 hypothetical protein LEM8419_00754 [Neolewinella maritima]